ncbi:unnamed protein product [Coccothraustes coccothraustes]
MGNSRGQKREIKESCCSSAAKWLRLRSWRTAGAGPPLADTCREREREREWERVAPLLQTGERGASPVPSRPGRGASSVRDPSSVRPRRSQHGGAFSLTGSPALLSLLAPFHGWEGFLGLLLVFSLKELHSKFHLSVGRPRPGRTEVPDCTYHNASRGDGSRDGRPLGSCGTLGSVVYLRRAAWRLKAEREEQGTTTPVGPCAASSVSRGREGAVRGSRLVTAPLAADPGA